MAGSMWALFFVWLAAYSLLSIAALVYCQSALYYGGEGWRRRLAPRMVKVSVMRLLCSVSLAAWPIGSMTDGIAPSDVTMHQVRASSMYTAAFSAYWAALGVVYACIYWGYDHPGSDPSDSAGVTLRAAFAALLSLAGFWDVAVWCVVQHACYPGALSLCCKPLKSTVRAGLSNLISSLMHGARSERLRWLHGGAPPHQASPYRITPDCPARERSRDSTVMSRPLAPRRLTMTDADLVNHEIGGGLQEATIPSAACEYAAAAASSQACPSTPPVGPRSSGNARRQEGVSTVASSEAIKGTRKTLPSGTPEPTLPHEDEDDISDALRREFVRQTIVGIVTSTRTVNAEMACASPAFESADFVGMSHWEGGRNGVEHPSNQSANLSAPCRARGQLSHSCELSVPLLTGSSQGHCGDGKSCAVPTYQPPSAANLQNDLEAPYCGIDPAVRQLRRTHFSEVFTLELADGVYFQDFAPMVWQALRQTVYHVPFTHYLSSLMGSSMEMEDSIEAMLGNFSEGGSGGFFFLSPDRCACKGHDDCAWL